MEQKVLMHVEDENVAKKIAVQPQPAKVYNVFIEALEKEKKGDMKGAERDYLEMLNEHFDCVPVLAALGMNYSVTGKNGLAFALLTRAVEKFDNMLADFKKLGIHQKGDKADDIATFMRAKKAEILNALGTTYKHENRTAEARKMFDEAQSLVPLNADIQNNMATLYINEGDPKKSLEHLNKALSQDPNHAQANWNASLAYLELGDYKTGFGLYKWGVPANVRMRREYSKEPLPNWDGSKGKRIVVYGEQGLGDEIMFASMLQELINDSELVVYDCHKRLHKLMANSFPSIDIYPTREDEQILWPLNPDGSSKYNFTHSIAIGELGEFYRPDLSSFPATPYIHPTTASEAKWRERLDTLPKRPNVGIHWIGGHKRTRIEVRSVPLIQLLPILKDRDVNWISLQYTHSEEEIAQFEKETGIKIHHWPDCVYADQYDETAGLVSNLDLVITVCTSVVHLAGSMGVPCWVLTPSRPAWRYRLDLDYMPWYPTCTLFRQSKGSVDWAPVINEVAGSLGAMLEGMNNENK